MLAFSAIAKPYSTIGPLGSPLERANYDVRSYECGFCGNRVGPNQGWQALNTPSVRILICSHCNQPTFLDEDGKQWPGATYGAPVGGLPEDVATIYDEARRCMSISAYNTAVIACRKLLMHIAVEKGAEGNKSFLTISPLGGWAARVWLRYRQLTPARWGQNCRVGDMVRDIKAAAEDRRHRR